MTAYLHGISWNMTGQSFGFGYLESLKSNDDVFFVGKWIIIGIERYFRQMKRTIWEIQIIFVTENQPFIKRQQHNKIQLDRFCCHISIRFMGCDYPTCEDVFRLWRLWRYTCGSNGISAARFISKYQTTLLTVDFVSTGTCTCEIM